MATDRGSDVVASDVVRKHLGDLLLGLVPLGAVAAATWGLAGLPATYLGVTAGFYAAMGALVVGGAARGYGGRVGGAGMGAANRVTLFRATLALPLAALAFFWGTSMAAGPTDAGRTAAELTAWWTIVISSIAMILDAVDGPVARRTGTGSVLGARFDMELDAFFLLALSWLVFVSGRAGPWVLAIGALRYLFVAAGWITARMRGDLPESFRRKTACVVAGIALLVSLGPIIPPRVAVLCAAIGLLSLVYSFAVDVAWLLGRPANREPAEGH